MNKVAATMPQRKELSYLPETLKKFLDVELADPLAPLRETKVKIPCNAFHNHGRGRDFDKKID